MSETTNLSIDSIANDLKSIIIESLELNIKPEQINGEDLINELNINSVDALEILVRVENKFKIVVPDEDLNVSLIATLEGFALYIHDNCQSSES